MLTFYHPKTCLGVRMCKQVSCDVWFVQQETPSTQRATSDSTIQTTHMSNIAYPPIVAPVAFSGLSARMMHSGNCAGTPSTFMWPRSSCNAASCEYKAYQLDLVFCRIETCTRQESAQHLQAGPELVALPHDAPQKYPLQSKGCRQWYMCGDPAAPGPATPATPASSP